VAVVVGGRVRAPFLEPHYAWLDEVHSGEEAAHLLAGAVGELLLE